MIQDFRGEVLLFDLQLEGCSWQRIKVVDADIIGDSHLLFAGDSIRQREGSARNHCARGVSHHTLNGSAVLRPGTRCNKSQREHQKDWADGYSTYAHASTSPRRVLGRGCF